MVTKKKFQQSKRVQAPRTSRASERHQASRNVKKQVTLVNFEKTNRWLSGRQQSRKSGQGQNRSASRLLVTPAATEMKSKMATPEDAYEFMETDDFITGTLASAASHAKSKKTSGSSTKRSAQKGKATGIPTKSSVNSKNVSVKGVRSQDKKQTSTPVGSATGKVASKLKNQGQCLGKRRSPRGPPDLLDISVTPILPVPSSLSPKRRRPNDYCPQNGSYIVPVVVQADSKRQSKPLTLTSPDSGSQPRQHRSNSQAKALKQLCTPTSVLSGKRNLKTKKDPVKPSNLVGASEGGEKKSTGVKGEEKKNSTRRSAHKKLKHSPKNMKSLSDSKGRVTTAKPKKNKAGSQESGRVEASTPLTHLAQCQADTSPHKKVKRKDVWEPGNEEMYCLSVDSGISLGSDLSSSMTSPETGSFPGFMEDEPLPGASEDLSFSPPPANSSGAPSHDPESALNKSSSKSYKTSKIKREKGRYSTSRLDAWASLVNQHMEDAESFELVIEG